MTETYGAAEEVGSGVLRVLAPNPSHMTYLGTCSYILTDSGRAGIVDPGPALDDHETALLRALDGRPVDWIVVTHAHLDHSPLAARLGQRLGAPVIGRPPEAVNDLL